MPRTPQGAEAASNDGVRALGSASGELGQFGDGQPVPGADPLHARPAQVTLASPGAGGGPGAPPAAVVSHQTAYEVEHGLPSATRARGERASVISRLGGFGFAQSQQFHTLLNNIDLINVFNINQTPDEQLIELTGFFVPATKRPHATHCR